MEELVSAARQVVGDPVSQVFVYSIGAVFAAAFTGHLLGAAFRVRAFQRLSAGGPALCTTIGVLGTFAGIFIGLLDFDVARIDESVPQLLLGLKIAFGTSIVGMSAAIALKAVQILVPLATTSSGASADDIHQALLGIQGEVRSGSNTVRGEVETLRRAISSEGESSLLSQLQKLRLEVVDGQRELIVEFRSFAATMAETNSKALIQALEQVIRDFNAKLTEQFGENFKQLNEAVGALLVWQDRYREQVETLHAAFMMALDGVGRAEQSLGQVREHTAAIPAATKEIVLIVGDVRAGLDALRANLEAFAGMREKAAEALPIIEGNINRLTADFSSLVSASVKEAETGLKSNRKAFGELHGGYHDLLVNAGKAQTEFAGAIETTLVAVREQLEKALHEHGRIIETTAQQVQRDINDAWKKTEDGINGRMEALDKELQEELNRTMTAFGRHLAAVSEKFVADYTPLTERLRALVSVGGHLS